MTTSDSTNNGNGPINGDRNPQDRAFRHNACGN